jgi:hypothetical protein
MAHGTHRRIAVRDSAMALLEPLRLGHLEGLGDLQYLTLSGKGITDDGLKHLKGLKKLSYLTLEKTSVTPEGVNALKKELPNVNITVF